MSHVIPTAGVSRRRPPSRFLLIAITASLTLVGCILGRRPPATIPSSPINAPAVPAPSPTAAELGTPQPSPTSGPCFNDAQFLADETIPDGTQVEPGAALDKRWQVRNSGTCDWGPGYALEHVSGPPMGAEAVTALFPARAGAEVALRLQLTAPGEPGEHTATWQLRDGQGQPFGDVLFVKIVVSEAP